MRESRLNPPEMTIGRKLLQMNWTLLLLLCAIASIGFVMLYSAAGGSLQPWASRQMVWFAIGLTGLVVAALVDIRLWFRFSYLFYFGALLLLIAVPLVGAEAKGAQRWLQLGPMQVQPSEIMKLALVLALARYFHGGTLEDVGRPLFLIPPLLMVLVPAALVLRQPDLGTALLLVIIAGGLFFMAGVRLWMFALVGGGGIGAIPAVWPFLEDYQKQRILTLFNPDSDPLGHGWNIIQAMIAAGSGGIFGKGYMQGTQGNLSFLPEKHTDFIFTLYAEEFGLVGNLALLGLYTLVLIYGIAISLRCRSQFGRLVGIGVTITFFLYVFINIAMVMGMIPVVGVPLPLVSYGGTALVTLLFGFGLLMNVWVHRDVEIGRRGADDF